MAPTLTLIYLLCILTSVMAKGQAFAHYMYSVPCTCTSLCPFNRRTDIQSTHNQTPFQDHWINKCWAHCTHACPHLHLTYLISCYAYALCVIPLNFGNTIVLYPKYVPCHSIGQSCHQLHKISIRLSTKSHSRYTLQSVAATIPSCTPSNTHLHQSALVLDEVASQPHDLHGWISDRAVACWVERHIWDGSSLGVYLHHLSLQSAEDSFVDHSSWKERQAQHQMLLLAMSVGSCSVHTIKSCIGNVYIHHHTESSINESHVVHNIIIILSYPSPVSQSSPYSSKEWSMDIGVE